MIATDSLSFLPRKGQIFFVHSGMAVVSSVVNFDSEIVGLSFFYICLVFSKFLLDEASTEDLTR